MPTVFRVGGFRFFFYAGDRAEPPHVHVERGDSIAKFWLRSVRLSRSNGFSVSELNRLRRIVMANRKQLLESWEDYFRG